MTDEPVRIGLLLVEAVIAGRARAAARRAAAAVAATAVAIVLACAAIGCLMAALWAYVRPTLGPVGTPLLVAAVLFGLGGAVALLPRLRRNSRARQTAPDSALLDEAARLAREHKGGALLAALCTGFAMGQKRK